MITLHFFASLREKLQRDSLTLEWQDGTVRELVTRLCARDDAAWSQVLRDERVMVAVNQEVVSFDAVIADGDEVAFFPPVTGG